MKSHITSDDDTSLSNYDDDSEREQEQDQEHDQDTLIKHMDSIVDEINNMRWCDVIYVCLDPEPDVNSRYCRISSNIRFNSYIFSGYGSKKILRYFMEKNKQYTRIIQLLNKRQYRRFIPIRDWESFWDSYADELVCNRLIFELIRSDQPCKPYLDIEWIVTKGDARKMNYTNFINKIQTDIKKIFLTRYNIVLDEDSIMITSSHSEKKASFHVIIDHTQDNKTIVFKTNRKGYNSSAYDLAHALIALDGYYEKVIDKSVYTTDREFRMLYSNKTNEFRPIIPYGTTIKEDSLIKLSRDNCLRYAITHIKEYIIIKTPEISQDYVYTYNNFVPQVHSNHKINKLLDLARKIHRTAVYTGPASMGKGWRFTYHDKTEPCYTGNMHTSNGFYIYENDEGMIYMKCMSENCKGIYVLEKKTINKKIF